MSAARTTVRAWSLELRAALAELVAARLRWCLLCGRVGLWRWRPLTPSMPITWVCADRAGCQQRQAMAARWERGGGPGRLPETARAALDRGSGPALAPRLGSGRSGPFFRPRTARGRPQPFLLSRRPHRCHPVPRQPAPRCRAAPHRC
jgi:hypothetical protein